MEWEGSIVIGRVPPSMTAPEREQLARMVPTRRLSRFIDRLESLFREVPPTAHLIVLGCEIVTGTLDEVDAALAGFPTR